MVFYHPNSSKIKFIFFCYTLTWLSFLRDDENSCQNGTSINGELMGTLQSNEDPRHHRYRHQTEDNLQKQLYTSSFPGN